MLALDTLAERKKEADTLQQMWQLKKEKKAAPKKKNLRRKKDEKFI